MNLLQIKYARTRAETVFLERNAAIKAKHTLPAVRLSRAEKLAALLAGQFVIDETVGSYHWENAVSFTEERGEQVDREAIDAEQAALAAAYRKLEDELVLGDNEEALKLLQAFEDAAA